MSSSIMSFVGRPGYITRDQVDILKGVVAEIGRLTGKSPGDIWFTTYKRAHCNCTSYVEMTAEAFPKAEQFLRAWLAREARPYNPDLPPTKKQQEESLREIFKEARNRLGWSKEDVERLAFKEHYRPLTVLNPDEIDALYRSICARKSIRRSATIMARPGR